MASKIKIKNKTMSENKKIRLNKFIANSGLCSRRDADSYIKSGTVTVNGENIIKLGTKVEVTDIIKINGKRLKSEKLKYVLLNKAKTNNLTKTIIKKAYKESIIPVDKLTEMESGLLLLTNDKDLKNKLEDKKKSVKSVYHISLDKEFKEKDIKRMNQINSISAVSYVKGRDKKEVGIENTYGGVESVRKKFIELGYIIDTLDRVLFAGLTKKDLPRKHYRNLSENEVGLLKRI